MPLLATLALIQIQILFTMFFAWTSFTWLGFCVAACIVLMLAVSNSFQDFLSNQASEAFLSWKYSIQVELFMRVAFQIALIAMIIRCSEAFFPDAFAMTWFNFQIPYLWSVVAGSFVIGFVSVLSQFVDIPSSVGQYVEMTEL